MSFLPNGNDDEMRKGMMRLIEAFNTAASNATGPSRELFRKLKESFDGSMELKSLYIDKHPEIEQMMMSGSITDALKAEWMMAQDAEGREALRMEITFAKTLYEITRLASTDPEVAKNFAPINDAMQSMQKSMLGGLLSKGLPGNGGLGDLLGGGKGGGLGDLLGGLLGGGDGQGGATPSTGGSPQAPTPRPRKQPGKKGPTPGNDGPVSL